MENKIIINVGRQFGSGGKLVALELGKMLGIHVYDNELITKAAETSGFSPDVFKKKDEKRNMFPVSSFFATQTFGAPKNFLNGENLFQIQSSVIRDIAEKESAVIVGRCADYVLKDEKNVLSLFLYAEKQDRIRRGIELYHIDAKHAQETMERFDRKRARFYEYYTDRKWGALSNYDMMINTSRMGIDQCVRFLATAARAMMETDD